MTSNLRPRNDARYGLQFGQDSRRVGVAPQPHKSRQIGSWDIRGETSKLVALAPAGSLNATAFSSAMSADGRYLYWAANSYLDVIYRVRLRTPFMILTGEFDKIEAISIPPLGNVGGFSFSPDGRYFVAMREGASSSGSHFAFQMSSPWDLKSAVLISSRNYGDTGNTERFLGVIQNGTRLIGDNGLVPAMLSPRWRGLLPGSNGGMDLTRFYYETPDGRYRFSSGKGGDDAITRERLSPRYGLTSDETIVVGLASYGTSVAAKQFHGGAFCFSLDGRYLYILFTDRSVAQIRLRG